jgi:hypothetical protein
LSAAASAVVKGSNNHVFNIGKPTEIEVAASNLLDGMVLCRNIYSKKGLILAGTGNKLSEKTIETIQASIGESKLKTTIIYIEVGSIPHNVNIESLAPQSSDY